MNALRIPRRATQLVAVALFTLIFTLDAAAWGARGRKAITMAALQVIRERFNDAFKADKSEYHPDLLKGAEDGIGLIQKNQPMQNDDQTLAAIQHEIQLLREIRERGTGSYFAYRMGTLAALVSEVIIPYGIAYSESDRRLQGLLDEDLDAMVPTFEYSTAYRDPVYLRSMREYFADKRLYYPNDLKLVADDYASGRGPRGFLSEAGQTYFTRAVEAVTDAWFTVLYRAGEDAPISPRFTARYYVNEIEYLINEKKNLAQADRAYSMFREIDPGMPEVYEHIGDLYYAFGTDAARERGVKEWQIAQSQPGPQRQRAAAKLAKHYIERGDDFYRKGKSANAAHTDLNESLRSFQQALEFDRSNDIAAARIKETTAAIKARDEKEAFMNNVIANALAVTAEAERAGLQSDFAVAIHTYRQALGLLDVVDNEFKELKAVADETRGTINKAIKGIYSEVLNRGEVLIEDGNRALEERRFEDAIASYSMVSQVVAAIPAEENSITADNKNEIIQRAANLTDEAKLAQARFQEDQAAAAAATAPKKGPFDP